MIHSDVLMNFNIINITSESMRVMMFLCDCNCQIMERTADTEA